MTQNPHGLSPATVNELEAALSKSKHRCNTYREEALYHLAVAHRAMDNERREAALMSQLRFDLLQLTTPSNMKPNEAALPAPHVSLLDTAFDPVEADGATDGSTYGTEHMGDFRLAENAAFPVVTQPR